MATIVTWFALHEKACTEPLMGVRRGDCPGCEMTCFYVQAEFEPSGTVKDRIGQARTAARRMALIAAEHMAEDG